MQIAPDFVRSLPGDPVALSVQASRWQRWHIDLPLLLMLVALSMYGLAVLYSASGMSPGRVMRQAVYLLVAFGAMIFVAQFKVKTLRQLAPLGYLLGILLLILVALFGVGAKGAQRWLNVFGLIQFQPSEIMKIVTPLTVAWYFADRVLPPKARYLLAGAFIALLPSVLIAMQPDLGTALLVASSGLFALWLAGIRWRYMVVAAIGLVASAWPFWQYGLHDYQRQRILTLFNPESDKLGAGWNIIQSKTAIGSGGWGGKGWLNGTQSHLDFLPESHTDFIIAVLAEEFGLVGVLALIILYCMIILRCAYISLLAKDTFARLAAGSITLIFCVYILVNMGMVAGMLPVVGVPLPLMSYGGTALVTMMASFGILMAIGTEQRAV